MATSRIAIGAGAMMCDVPLQVETNSSNYLHFIVDLTSDFNRVVDDSRTHFKVVQDSLHIVGVNGVNTTVVWPLRSTA